MPNPGLMDSRLAVIHIMLSEISQRPTIVASFLGSPPAFFCFLLICLGPQKLVTITEMQYQY